MAHELVIVLDFGGQYNQLIARRVRECNVYCEVKPFTTPLSELKAMNPIRHHLHRRPQLRLSGGSPMWIPDLYLGRAHSGHLLRLPAHRSHSGRQSHRGPGRLRPGSTGKTETFFDTVCPLFKGLPESGISWMSHGDYMAKVPDGFELVAHSNACPNVGIADVKRGLWRAVPPEGQPHRARTDMIRNFPL